MALYMMAFSVAHIFGHNSGMQLINAFGYTTTWYVMGGLQLVGIACLVWLMRRVKNEANQPTHIP